MNSDCTEKEGRITLHIPQNPESSWRRESTPYLREQTTSFEEFPLRSGRRTTSAFGNGGAWSPPASHLLTPGTWVARNFCLLLENTLPNVLILLKAMIPVRQFPPWKFKFLIFVQVSEICSKHHTMHSKLSDAALNFFHILDAVQMAKHRGVSGSSPAEAHKQQAPSPSKNVSLLRPSMCAVSSLTYNTQESGRQKKRRLNPRPGKL